MVDDLEQFKKKYKQKLKQQLATRVEAKIAVPHSKNYLDFKKENYPTHMSLFEKAAAFAQKILNVSPDKKTKEAMAQSLKIAHSTATPEGVYALALLVPLALILFGFFLNMLLPFLIGTDAGMFGIFLFVFLGGLAYYIIINLPKNFETDWRMQAASEMVLAVFYIVTYMRHTSNLENALAFAAEHLSGPLALDLKKVLWDVETEEYESIKESLDAYLEFWKDTNMEFVEAMHLIESSLYEGAESRRIEMLEKALDVILEETYEKMLHYAQNLKAPITTLHMLGIILPILGLVMLPLIGGFMTSSTHPLKIVLMVAGIYNVIIPVSVYYFGRSILATRPGGYGNIDLSKLKKFKVYKGIPLLIGGKRYTLSPLIFSLLIGFLLIGMSLLPLLLKPMTNSDLVYLPGKYRGGSFEIVAFTNPKYDLSTFQFLGYKKAQLKEIQGQLIGPYGLGASFLSLLFPLGIALAIGFYYKYKTKYLMEIRENSKKLENEFASSLFQLGNRLGDGLPAEIAFQKVSETTQGTLTGRFFFLVANNIRRLGMSVKEALFDPLNGAVKEFPSSLIESSMKVLIQAAKKGPLIAAQALINISKYVKEIHRVEERLKDLMADVISSMKSQINFLTPVIAGVVVGITSMVTFILSKLKAQIDRVMAGGSGASTAMQFQGLLNMFGDGIPTYFLQIVIGMYVVELIYILSLVTNRIENGADSLSEQYTIGNNLIKSTVTYVVLAFFVMLLFNMLAAKFVKVS